MPRASPSGNLVGSIRKAIAQRLAQGHPGIRDVAASFGLNVRTLQRRLARIGLTYSGLVGEIRLETAAGLLEEGSLTSAKIASALGYSDPAHFSRAFSPLDRHGAADLPAAAQARLLRTTWPPERLVGKMTTVAFRALRRGQAEDPLTGATRSI